MQARKQYRRRRQNNYVRGYGEYTVPYKAGRVYMRGRGAYRAAKKKASAWSAPSIGSSIGGALGAVAAPIAAEYLGPGISSSLPALGSMVGKGAGSLFKKITGMGDYTVHDNSLLFPDRVVPQFGEDSIRIRKREMISIIDASSSFQNLSIPIQPGLDNSFPWLSRIAANYEQYHINGMIFQFVSTSSDAIASTTDLALGTVALATDYDANDAPFVNLPQMLGSMFANSGKPSQDIMHAIECDPAQQAQKLYYVRTGDVPTGADARLYDLGIFQIAFQGPATYTDAGQLWVSYDITFTKSVQNNQLGFAVNTDWFFITSPTAADPFGASGTATLKDGSNFGVSLTNNDIEFPSTLSSGYFQITYRAFGTSATIVQPTFTPTNCTLVTAEYLNGGATGIQPSGASTMLVWQLVFRIDATAASIAVTSGTYPAAATGADLIIQQVNGEIFI